MDYEKAYKGARERCRWQLANKLISEECATDLFRDIKESEDEKIRKALIHLINEQDGFLTAINGISVKDIIAYLERMKEQKSEIKYIYPIFKVGDTIKPKAYNESHRIDKIKNDTYVLDNGFTFPIVDQDVWEIVEQNPAEWSEKDKRMISLIIGEFETIKVQASTQFEKTIADEKIAWLKNHLKSLRPQPHWKSSEEQMEALRAAMEHKVCYCRCNHQALKSLYNDLQNYSIHEI